MLLAEMSLDKIHKIEIHTYTRWSNQVWNQKDKQQLFFQWGVEFFVQLLILNIMHGMSVTSQQ